MRTMVAAGFLALAPLAMSHAGERPLLHQTPAAAPRPVPDQPAPGTPAPAQPAPTQPAPTQSAPTQPVPNQPAPAKPAPADKPAAAKPAAAAPSGTMEAPKLPPFAGEVVNFDRRGARVVACVDASKVQMPSRPGPDGKPVPPPTPAGPPGPPRFRIWVLEREVMQELMTTGGLCDPAWSPDGKTFAAVGVRGVFTFTEPNFVPRVLVAGQLQAPPPGAPPAREYDDPVWAPGGGRIAFRSTAGGVSRVEVVDIASAEVLLKRDGAVKTIRWADDRTLLVDATRVPVP